MAAPQPKEVLERYRTLLAQNLILTDDFYRVLITHGVFSEHLINEIKVSLIKPSTPVYYYSKHRVVQAFYLNSMNYLGQTF